MRKIRTKGPHRNACWLIWIVLALVGVAAAVFRESTVPRTNTGRASGPGSTVGFATIADGDTLRIGGFRLRLTDIDAPELNQCCKDAQGRLVKCGAIAKSHLARLVTGKSISCSWQEADPNGRPLANCRTETFDVNARMVEDGQAIIYHRRHEKSAAWRQSRRYLAEQNRAREAGRGIHAYSDFEPPHILRHNERRGITPRITGC